MHRAPIRVLATAFAPVPGSSPHAAAMLGLAAAVHGELDLVTVKTDALSHVEDVPGARMFRVPVGVGTAAEQRRAFGRAVARRLESQAYDAIHVRGPIEGRVVAERRRALGFRLVYEVATFPDEGESVDAEQEWEAAHRICTDAADLILVPTEAAARGLTEEGHGGKVAVVTPGVDVNTFDWWPAAPDDTVRLLYLGHFDADRDLGTLIEATRILTRDHTLEVLLAGDPDIDRRARLRRVVDAFSLTGVVTVRGEPRPDALPMIIGAADICVATAAASPRFQDMGDLPQPLLEYLACRRPVVAAGVPGLAEVIRDDKEALLYPPGDEAVLADSIGLLIRTPLLRERLVEAAYDRVRWTYGEGARRRRIAEVYEMLFAESQLYDPWDEGFDEPETGLVEVPSALLREETGGFEDEQGTGPLAAPELPLLEDERGLEAAETGQVLYRPHRDEQPGDTNPHVPPLKPEPELEIERTRVSPHSPTPIAPRTALGSVDGEETASEAPSYTALAAAIAAATEPAPADTGQRELPSGKKRRDEDTNQVDLKKTQKGPTPPPSD